MKLLITFAFALLLGVLCEAKVPSVKDVKLAKATIAKLINQRSNKNQDFWWIAGFLRLVWHDSVGKGGLDGCIDYANTANNGLNLYSQDLNAVYDQNFKSAMSRADFYALAAATGLEMAGNDRRAAGTRFDANKLKFGRKDCATSPNEDETTEQFPSSKIGWDEMMAYFKKMFEVDGADFTAKDLVALMGAHKLGKATVRNSGYRGEWMTGGGCSSRLNLKYFIRVLTGPKRHQVPAKTKWADKSCLYQPNVNLQWKDRTKNTGIMMDADLALAWKFKSDPKTGTIDCTICEEGNQDEKCCKHSPGYAEIIKYLDPTTKKGKMKFKKGSSVYGADFQAIIYRMMNLHHEDLQELGEDLPKAIKVYTPSEGKFQSFQPWKDYKSLEEAMADQLGDVNWTDIPDLTAILDAKRPDYPKAPLEKCERGGKKKMKGKKKKKGKKWKKSKKSDEPMEDEDAFEDVSAMEFLEDEIQDIEEDIDDFVDELENTD